MSGAWVVDGGARLSGQEARVVREALARGEQVQFRNRHQWRHFQVRGDGRV